MLLQLNIKNFALIRELSVEFSKGFNILSGETGAGKSILIDAIDYVLGGKFSKDLIRYGEEKTFVEAVFSIENSELLKELEEFNIEDEILIISRETTIYGKSLVKVNGRTLVLSSLKRLREKILDIHGQHQSQGLLNKANHIKYLDDFIGEEIYIYLKEFTKLKEEQNTILEKIKELNGTSDREKLVDYIKFQIEDIEKANLKVDEEENLKEEFNLLDRKSVV